ETAARRAGSRPGCGDTLLGRCLATNPIGYVCVPVLAASDGRVVVVCGADPAVCAWCGARFFFSSRRRHTRFSRDWSSDVCSSDLGDRHPACDHAERGGGVGQATGMREVHDGLCEEDQCGGGEGEHGGEECERGGGEEEFSFHRAAFRRACRWMRVSAVTYTAS